MIYAGTASKTLMPGLRLAWLAVPPDWLEPVVEAKRLTDRHTGVLDQLALAELLASGAFDRHIRRMHAQYRRRRDYLVRALAERVPALQPSGIAAGLHLVIDRRAAAAARTLVGVLPTSSRDEILKLAPALSREVQELLRHVGALNGEPDRTWGSAAVLRSWSGTENLEERLSDAGIDPVACASCASGRTAEAT